MTLDMRRETRQRINHLFNCDVSIVIIFVPAEIASHYIKVKVLVTEVQRQNNDLE